MRAKIFHELLLSVSLSGMLACSFEPSQELNPEKLPFRFEEGLSFDREPSVIDLNADGKDEIVTVSPYSYTLATGIGDIHIQSHEGHIIEQVNYAGWMLSPKFLDLEKDGRPEIAVPFVRNDSLFVSVVNAQGAKLFSFFLISGQPRREDNNFIAWDPAIIEFHLLDLNGDGIDELVTIICTDLARSPRGILIHSLPDGRPLGQKLVGAAISEGFVDNYDVDGFKEIMVRTVAPNNGNATGGFDDRHSYLIVFKLCLPPEIIWSKQMGNLWSLANLFYDDFNGDGKREFLAFSGTESSRPEKSQLEMIEPGTWRTLQKLTIDEPLRRAQVMDLNRDGKPEILALRAPGDILLLDHKFDTIKRRTLANLLIGLDILPDVDGDGIQEIVTGTTQFSLLLEPDLTVKAILPKGQIRGFGAGQKGIMRRGIGMPPYLIAERDGVAVTLRLRRNKFYLINRYRTFATWIFSLGIISALAIVLSALRRRSQLQLMIQKFVLDTDERGLLLLNTAGKIVMVNATWRQWVKQKNKHQRRASTSYESLEAPELVAFLRQAMSPPERRREAMLALAFRGRPQSVQVVADPVTLPGEERPYWLVSLFGRSVEMDIEKAKTWSAMAQRVAHDIKNPLTSILLTLQRLQMEYRGRSPEMAQVYDAYTSKIMERIESLRRMTRNFMKFVNSEQLHLVETDLNGFLKQVSEKSSRNLPPDIKMELQLSADLCLVRVDEEQMQLLLENLISNAVNAMPAGGKITIATHLALNLQLRALDENSRDYVVLEVQDTGVGIPEAARERLFDPNFTATEGGTGLGLAIVKKIVEGHDGYIEVESEPGVGTAFSVYLPVT